MIASKGRDNSVPVITYIFRPRTQDSSTPLGWFEFLNDFNLFNIFSTASITNKHVKKLQKLTLHRAAYHLTGSEMLAVTFAALLQNLGHPAFSYVYRECFDMPTVSQNLKYKLKLKVYFQHYEMAVKLFDKMLADEPRIKKELNKYFGDYHFTLIRQLINPPPMFDSEGKWNLVVSREKAYVFDIVNNRRNGLDADKLDYLYRDALRTGLESINMVIFQYGIIFPN